MEQVDATQNLLILYWISRVCVQWVLVYQLFLSTSLEVISTKLLTSIRDIWKFYFFVLAGKLSFSFR